MLCVFLPDEIIEQHQVIDVREWNFDDIKEWGFDFSLNHACLLDIIITKNLFSFSLRNDKNQIIYKIRTPIKSHKYHSDYVFMSVVREVYNGSYYHNAVGGYQRARYFVKQFCNFRYLLLDRDLNTYTPKEFMQEEQYA